MIRLSQRYNLAVMLIGELVALLASLALSVDALVLAKAPKAVLGCDLGTRISCSAVAKSKWSSIIHLWGADVPNAMFGLAAFGIFIGFTVAIMAGLRPRGLVRHLFAIGMAACILFAVYLLTVSVFALGTLCPWCLTLDVGIMLMTIGYVRWIRLTYHPSLHHDILSSWVSAVIELVPFAIIALIVVMFM